MDKFWIARLESTLGLLPLYCHYFTNELASVLSADVSFEALPQREVGVTADTVHYLIKSNQTLKIIMILKGFVFKPP